MHSFTLLKNPGRRQNGAGLVEFALVAIPILLAGLGAIETARWFFVKQAVSLALLQAGRAGITQNASPESIEYAFEQALLPLFSGTSPQGAAQQLSKALAHRAERMHGPPWQIQILNPSAEAFADFRDPHAVHAANAALAAINNNYQAEQDHSHQQAGRPHGKGPISGQTIYQANTLALRLTYLHEPMFPGLRGLLPMIAQGEDFRARGFGAGFLPIQQELTLTMQSNPVLWPDFVNGKVVRDVRSVGPGVTETTRCEGIWCTDGGAGRSLGSRAPAWAPGRILNGAGMPLPNVGTPQLPPAIPPPLPDLPPSPTAPPLSDGSNPSLNGPPEIDPNCGITLCCVV